MASARSRALTLIVLCVRAGAGQASSMSSGAVASTLNARLNYLTDAFIRRPVASHVHRAELKLFFERILDAGRKKNYVRPNKNCNLTSSVDRCELGRGYAADDTVNVPMLPTSLDCRGCYPGIFCPHSL